MAIEKQFPVEQARKYSEKEQSDILRDVLDSNKTQVVCGRHSYIGSEKPPQPLGCKDCWQAYWIHKIASTPPHLRQQRLEEAYRATYDAVRAYERGKWDFEPSDHAVIESEKPS